MEAHDDHVTSALMNLHQNLEQNFTQQMKNTYDIIQHTHVEVQEVGDIWST